MSEEEKQSVVNEINSQIAMGVKVLLIAIIPMSMAGLGLLVSNHFGQIALKTQVEELAKDTKAVNEKVAIMWLVGGYEQRFQTYKKETQ